MSTLNTIARRLAALFLAGVAVLLSPLVGAFNEMPPVLGYPATLLFLLVAWVSLVVLAGLVVRRGGR